MYVFAVAFDLIPVVERIQLIGNLWEWFLFHHGFWCLHFWVNQIFVKVNSDK